MDQHYTFIISIRAFEVEIALDGGDVVKHTVIADGFADCVEIMNERLHELGLSPFALKFIRTLPRIILTDKGLEVLGDEIC